MNELIDMLDLRKEFNLSKGEWGTWFPYIGVEYFKIGKKTYFKKEDYPKVKDFYSQPNLKEIKKKITSERRKSTNIKKYGGPSPMYSNEVREKIKSTCLEKYGETSALKNKDIRNKINETFIKKYGTDVIAHFPGMQEKTKQTRIEKYGTEFYFQSEEFKRKAKETKKDKYGDENFNNRNLAKETCLERYGVENPLQVPEVKEIIKNTNLKKYGVDVFWKSDTMKEKSKETCLKKYGVEKASQSEIVKERVKATNLKKFGVEYPMQSSEIVSKCHKHWKVEGFEEKFASKEEGYFYIYLKEHGYNFEYQIKYPKLWTDEFGNEHNYTSDFKVENNYVEIKGSQFFDSDGNAKFIYDINNPDYEKKLIIWKSKLKFINEQENIILINTKEFSKGGKYFYMKEYFESKYSFTK